MVVTRFWTDYGDYSFSPFDCVSYWFCLFFALCGRGIFMSYLGVASIFFFGLSAYVFISLLFPEKFE